MIIVYLILFIITAFQFLILHINQVPWIVYFNSFFLLFTYYNFGKISVMNAMVKMVKEQFEMVIDNGTENIEINSYEINEFHPDCKICEKYGKQPGFIYCKLCGPELEHAMKWISVKDRLPEKYDRALVTDGKSICIAYKQSGWNIGDQLGDDLTCITHSDHDCTFGSVTHWMPLPELPKDN